jgi:hypothetical protein
MTNHIEHKEDLLKDLIQQGSVEKAPEGFTDRVMAAIEIEESPVENEWWQQNMILLWGSIIIGFASLVVMIFLIDFSFMGSIFNGIELDGSRVSQFISYMGSGFVAIFEGFNVSSITISIIIAIAALFVLDRLLRRKPSVELRMI